MARNAGRTWSVPVEALFLARPNRFTAIVHLEGRRVKAHLPNPGRLTGTLAPGRVVLLVGPFARPRRLPYTVVAVREGTTLVGTVTTYANELFLRGWQAGLFPELGHGPLLREVQRGRSRFDFQVGRTLVEVKSVTLARNRTGLFPDAVTARGARHLDELAQQARQGEPAAVVFVAQRGDVDRVGPAFDIDPRFTRSLREAAQAGVVLLACAARITPAGARGLRRVPVVLNPD
ncbi:MAG: DNA/RNA nuclease SfsA [Bryobacterales bacterium]|nr:DNA/RNA nuclease SfsA [Bryobacteraceae bacterium]MDW8353329.1 DNA/RNA nuclease SfsA [Bryobacterales bacterium]